ncbi:hypothetical protein AMJ44_12680 [candidate division WOR-1 bacterium DG_54_3]|uniref:Uncharacterized protein n=1 Tax=candidate division WOR-1 bacterium DG_54_3 TaxID=1703775 RepID=A0A0S7XQM8_UNCSA|nr:MAG: hypothetical protein AMJ44_12680 [candidate division WOR-1 bacterium DG_54_3]
MEEFSFLQAVIFVWIHANIADKVLTRGLILPFFSERIWFFSYQIAYKPSRACCSFILWSDASFFVNDWLRYFFCMDIVVSPFILGIIAGYNREKTESCYT